MDPPLSSFLAPALWYKDAIKLIWYRKAEGSGGGYSSTIHVDVNSLSKKREGQDSIPTVSIRLR